MKNTANKKKILFITDSMEGGGAQRVILNIVNGLDRERFEPHLLLLSLKGDLLDFLSGDVQVHSLDVTRARYAVKKLAVKLKEINPDLLFVTPAYMIVLVNITIKLHGIKIPYIARCPIIESIDLKMSEPFFTRWLAPYSYRQAKKIVITTDVMKNDLINSLNVNPEKLVKIVNPIDLIQIEQLCKKTVNDNWFDPDREYTLFIAMGRLVEQKGFGTLIKAFALLRKKAAGRLVILGEGPLRDKLNDLTKEFGVNDLVKMPGFKRNPYKYISKSDVFILSSRWEGLPNVILEAMACGVPVISTDISGTSEIIQNGLNGILVKEKNEYDLLEKMLVLSDDKIKRSELSKNASETIKRFDRSDIVKQYEKLFFDTIIDEKEKEMFYRSDQR